MNVTYRANVPLTNNTPNLERYERHSENSRRLAVAAGVVRTERLTLSGRVFEPRLMIIEKAQP